MKIIQFIKKVNNTELGKANTHQSYILIPSKADVLDIFDVQNENVSFEGGYNREYDLRYFVAGNNGEKRIVGLRNFYEDNQCIAGDEIVLSKCMQEGVITRNIKVNKRTNAIGFQKVRNGFYTASNEGFINAYNDLKTSDGKLIAIKQADSFRPRSDSPSPVNTYDIFLDGKSISQIVDKDSFEFINKNDIVFITSSMPWRKICFEVTE